MTTYDNNFFDYVNSGATNSAKEVLPVLLEVLNINSVLDVGCGQGAWLAVWQQLGVADITGLDGDYVNPEALLINNKQFIAHDLSKNFQLNRNFDIVQTLEVAEHLPESSARDFVNSLVNHGDLILFSAAPKGQGGDHHINEQDYDYWAKLFAEHKYQPIDFVRPQIKSRSNVEPWYRYNIFLFASPDAMNTLPSNITDKALPFGDKLPDVSPPLYKLRKKIIRLLPVAAMTLLAKLKERIVARQRAKNEGSS